MIPSEILAAPGEIEINAGHPTVAFLPSMAIERGAPEQFGLRRIVVPARGIRAINKHRMVHNSAMPQIEADPETYQVLADGVHLTCEPTTVLPLARRYFLY